LDICNSCRHKWIFVIVAGINNVDILFFSKKSKV
jgi:hypothetical protein